MKHLLPQINLLPHRYKRYGVWVLILGMPLMGILIFLLIRLEFITDSGAFFDKWNLPVVYYPICIGLALLNFSEEKEEDEMVQALRYKAFLSGVFYLIVGVLWLLFFSNISGFFRGREMGRRQVVCWVL